MNPARAWGSAVVSGYVKNAKTEAVSIITTTLASFHSFANIQLLCVIFFTSPRGVQSIVMNMSVCLFVCLHPLA